MNDLPKLPKLPYGEGTFFYHTTKTSTRIGYRKTFTLANGKKVKKTVYAETTKECMDKMRKVDKEINNAPTLSNILLVDEMNYWVSTIKKPQLKPQSYDRICRTIKSQIEPSDIGRMKYQSITSDNIQNVIKQLNDEGYSYSVIKKTYDALNSFYKYVSARDKFVNPMALVIMPTNANVKKEDKEIVWFEKDDIDLFIEECHSRYNTGTPKYIGALALAANIYLGLRIGELVALQWKDIDFEKNMIYVSKTWVKIDNPNYDPNDPKSTKQICQIQNSNKTSKNRFVPIIPQAKKLLLEHKMTCKFTEPDDYVISTKFRGFSDAYKCNDTIKAICKAANTKVQNATTHSLRHTCASLLFRAGNPIEIICQILGNSREVCEKTYVHFVEEQIKEAANKVAQNLKVNF